MKSFNKWFDFCPVLNRFPACRHGFWSPPHPAFLSNGSANTFLIQDVVGFSFFSRSCLFIGIGKKATVYRYGETLPAFRFHLLKGMFPFVEKLLSHLHQPILVAIWLHFFVSSPGKKGLLKKFSRIYDIGFMVV
jgi:hypothetical protein